MVGWYTALLYPNDILIKWPLPFNNGCLPIIFWNIWIHFNFILLSLLYTQTSTNDFIPNISTFDPNFFIRHAHGNVIADNNIYLFLYSDILLFKPIYFCQSHSKPEPPGNIPI